MCMSYCVAFCAEEKRRNSGERKFNVEVKRQSHDKHVHLFLSTALLCCNHEPPFSSSSSFSLIFCKISKLMQKSNRFIHGVAR